MSDLRYRVRNRWHPFSAKKNVFSWYRSCRYMAKLDTQKDLHQQYLTLTNFCIINKTALNIKASEYPCTILCCGREKHKQPFIFDNMFITGDTHSETIGRARLPAQVPGQWGHINCNSVRWGKKDFVLGWPEQPRGRIKISCIGTTGPTHQPRRTPFIFTLWVRSPQFQ